MKKFLKVDHFIGKEKAQAENEYYLLNYTKYSLKASFFNGAFFWHIYNRVEFFIIRLYYLFFNCIILLSTRYVVQVKNI